MSSAVFLDRDGVLNERPPPHDYVRSPRDFRWLPGAKEAIAALCRAGRRLVVISNQRGVARGLTTWATLEAIEQMIAAELEPLGARIEAFYYCPHDDADACDCRKPAPGLLHRAADDLGLSLGDSVFVGDTEADVLAGKAAGCFTIRLSAGERSEADAICSDLREAAALILVRPRVSVVVPAHNYGHYLESCLESVAEQTFPDFELVVVDDGSTDDTPAILTRWSDPRLRTIRHDEARGYAGAINAGLEAAGGEIVTVLDADDRMGRTAIERNVAVLDRHPDAGLSHSNARIIDGDGRLVGLAREVVASETVRCDRVFDRLLRGNFLVSASVYVRARCYRELGRFDPTPGHGEDWDMWLRIASRYPFVYIDEPLVERRIHTTNISYAHYRDHKDLQALEAILRKAFDQHRLDERGYSFERLYGKGYFKVLGSKAAVCPPSEVLRLAWEGTRRYPRAAASRATLALLAKIAAYRLLPCGVVASLRDRRYAARLPAAR